MKKESIIKMVLDIGEKFEKSDKEETYEIFYEVLHSSLFAIIKDFTEEEFELIPAPYRVTINKLEKEILEFCSKKYQDEFNIYVEEYGRFYVKKNNKPEEKNRIITKCKQPIGFITQEDEELSF